MERKSYTYQGEDLQLKSQNKNENYLSIMKGSVLKFYPDYSQALVNQIYEISVNNKLVFYAPDTLVKKLIEHSLVKTNKAEEIFDIEVPAMVMNPLSQSIVTYQKAFLDQLKNIDVAANAFEIMEPIGKIISALRKLTSESSNKINVNDLTQEQIKDIQMFSTTPILSNVDNKNVNINEVPYKYLDTIEKFALNTFARAIEWIEKENDYYMSKATLNDVVDIMVVASLINSGKLISAHEKMRRLDTFVREGFDNNLWEDFIDDNDKHSLLREEAKYNQLLESSKNKTLKMK